MLSATTAKYLINNAKCYCHVHIFQFPHFVRFLRGKSVFLKLLLYFIDSG